MIVIVAKMEIMKIILKIPRARKRQTYLKRSTATPSTISTHSITSRLWEDNRSSQILKRWICFSYDFEKVFMFSLWFFAKLDEHWASRCWVFLRTWYPHYIIMMWSFAVVKQIFENLSWTMVNLNLIVMNHGEYSCNGDRVQWYNKYLKSCLWSI